MDIIEKAISQAEKLLQSVRCQYIIVTPDGEQRAHGALQLNNTQAKKTVTKRGLPIQKRGALKAIYAAPIDALQPGGVWTYVAESKMAADAMRGAACSHAIARYGSGNIMTSVEDTKVQVLRVA